MSAGKKLINGGGGRVQIRSSGWKKNKKINKWGEGGARLFGTSE